MQSKCEQYWAGKVGGAFETGLFSIVTASFVHMLDYEIRTLVLTNVSSYCGVWYEVCGMRVCGMRVCGMRVCGMWCVVCGMRVCGMRVCGVWCVV